QNAKLPLRRSPGGYATVGKVAVALVPGDCGVIGPAWLAARRVQCDHVAERCAQVQRAVDEQWCSLEGCVPALFRMVSVAGAIDPGDLQRLHVAAMNQRQR